MKKIFTFFVRLFAKIPSLLAETSIKSQYYLLLVWAVLVLCVGIATGPTTISDYFELGKSRGTLESATHKLEREIDHLSQEIGKINASKAYARRVLRDRYHLTGANERIQFFPE